MLDTSQSLATVTTTGYKGLHYIFYCWAHPKAWLQWLQLQRAMCILSVAVNIVKSGYSGYDWLQGVTCTFSAAVHIYY